MDKPGVSILIPLYNGVEYLKESVSSVINQTYKKWQLIIGINGHINDEEFIKNVIQCVQHLQKLNNKSDADIIIINYNTQGKSNTLNAMIANCKYDLIAILDVDDYWVSDKLETQLPFMQEYDIVGGDCQYFGDKEGIPEIPHGDISRYNIFNGNPIINSSVIIRKNDAIWDDPKYVQEVRGLDDYSMWFKLYYLKRKFYNIDKVLCYHRIYKNSAFNNSNNDNIDKLKLLWVKYIIKKNNIRIFN
jgi:teichuronic acid biosynthesis glycosyltransferase TuaG